MSMIVDQRLVMQMVKQTFKFKLDLQKETSRRSRFRLIKILLNEYRTETLLEHEEIEWKRVLLRSKSRKSELL